MATSTPGVLNAKPLSSWRTVLHPDHMGIKTKAAEIPKAGPDIILIAVFNFEMVYFCARGGQL